MLNKIETIEAMVVRYMPCSQICIDSYRPNGRHEPGCVGDLREDISAAIAERERRVHEQGLRRYPPRGRAMTPERLAELRLMVSNDGIPWDGADELAECLDEIERLAPCEAAMATLVEAAECAEHALGLGARHQNAQRFAREALQHAISLAAVAKLEGKP